MPLESSLVSTKVVFKSSYFSASDSDLDRYVPMSASGNSGPSCELGESNAWVCVTSMCRSSGA